MGKIITTEEFAALRPEISKGWEKDAEKINKCIEQAESVDLAEKLGIFYFEVIKRASANEWPELFEGSEFTYNGVNMDHIGLKKYVAGLTYIRFLGYVNATHTPHGYVNKQSQNSESVPYQQIKDEKKEEQRTLSFWFRNIEKYIEATPEIFAIYKPNEKAEIGHFSVRTKTLR